ncbi:hypothetical protein LAZ67_1003772 [Cordylochernes scorpioides]|uniref:Reverse transcriptase n=1 Tax=Cordylochernes scorpioides TaxID=51811 RepID=A0ABY6JYT0_9ARAC|nr:hypothetical protein LAZ67_1003772 [Cordylochernes scorpioides]
MYGLNLNPSKTQACLFQWRNVHPNSETGLRILGQPLNIKKTITILGVEFDQTRGFLELGFSTRWWYLPSFTERQHGGRRALSNEGIKQLRSLHYNFAKRVLRGGPCTPTVSDISITGSPPLDIIVSLNIEEITTPIIFTDGSKNEAGVGAAIVPLSEDQQPVLLRFHPDCTAFQAELLAIRWAVRLVEEGYSREEITIASDCKSALSAICTSGPVRSTLVAEIILALNTNQNVNLCWMPGHCGIDGNERADRAAKNAAVSTLEPSFSILPRSLARNHSRTAALDAWTEVYCRDHSNRHLRRIAHTPDRLLQFLPKVCPGEVITTLLTGHGHVRADLVLWHPGEDPSCLHCMEEQQTVDHLLFRCPAFMRHRMQTALLLGKTSFDPVSLAGLPGSLQAWNFLTSWFGSAIGSISNDYKKPNKENYKDPKAYRPISLSSNLGKIFESLIHIELLNHINSNNVMYPAQHGFTQEKSTSSALQEITKLSLQKRETENTAIVTVDISGAFDNAWHPAILQQLDKAKFPAVLIKKFNSYFEDRSVEFKYTNVKCIRKINKGCPQGGIISPILWNILLNDFNLSFNESFARVIAFADDVTFVVWSSNIYDLQYNITKCLIKIKAWCEKVKLSLSPNKTGILYLHNYEKLPINIDGKIIQPSETVKILSYF